MDKCILLDSNSFLHQSGVKVYLQKFCGAVDPSSFFGIITQQQCGRAAFLAAPASVQSQ